LLRHKKTPLHSKKRASPSVGGVAFAENITQMKDFFLVIGKE